MPPDEHDPPDHDALVLLRALGSDMPAPDAAVRNVFDRLATLLPAGALGTTDAAATDAVDAPPSDVLPGSAPPEPALMATANGAGAANPPAAGKLPHAVHALGNGAVAVARPWAWIVGLTLAGAGAGGGLHALLAPEKVRVVYVQSTSPERSPAGPHEAEDRAPKAPQDPPVPAAPAAPNAVGSAPADSVRSENSPGETALPSSANWSKERALLDVARRHLAAGEPDACLVQLGKHARTFPFGKLAEEREAMTVNALVAVGRYAEARDKAALFARRYPGSFLAPSVQAAISAIP